MIENLASEMTRIEEERASWRKAMVDTALARERLRELVQSSAYDQLAKTLEAVQSPALTFTSRHKSILAADSAIGSVFNTLQEAQRAEREQMLKIYEPMAEIRKSILNDEMQRLVQDFKSYSPLSDLLKKSTEHALGVGSVDKILAQQDGDARARIKTLLDSIGIDNSVRKYLKSFEQINKQWRVPSEVLGIMDSFKELQEQLGLDKLALPTIDWDSAAALAQAIGPEGIQTQLALLGIDSDGSMQQIERKPEKGILSKQQADVLNLITFALTLLMSAWSVYIFLSAQAKTDTFQTQIATTLEAQTQQLKALTILIEKALVLAAQEPEERFVVRERISTVRSRPEHGAAITGKLLPNEVVRAINKRGKWVEIEYYHWLQQEYQTGWVLKKYLERVPANF